jgi:UDP-4-amino-4,6-dideoxy-N-acetyl-beta-L-altrosamine N-acetyltransferase
MTADDADRTFAWRNLPQVAAFMYTDHRITPSEHATWFAAALSDRSRSYWIIEADGQPVGLANLYDISLPQKRAYLALYIADDRMRGRGVGTATDTFLLRLAFDELGLDKVCVEVLATNEPGQKVHLRQGFRVDGILRRHALKAGVRIDVVTMSLLREEWVANGGSSDG